jgi:RNA polymerase sigma-70 factor (ECF subfamily)
MRSDHLAAADDRPCSRPRAPSEFADLVDGYADRLVRFAFRRLGNIQDAEDIVHDVFVRMFTAERHDPIVLHGPYLFRSVGNACTDLCRRRARLDGLHDDMAFDRLSSVGPGPPEAAQIAEEQRRAEAMLTRLPPEQAETIRLRVFDGLSLNEIASVLDCPINTVSSRLRYGFQKLREAAGNEGSDHDLSRIQ